MIYHSRSISIGIQTWLGTSKAWWGGGNEVQTWPSIELTRQVTLTTVYHP